MRSHEPPRMATWLLRRFGGHPHNEAIIGDLVERYRIGGTVAWYWAQVITAVAVNAVRSRRAGKLAGLGVGLITAGSSMVWNVTFSPRIGMTHFNSYSLAAALLTILCAVFYWSQREGLANVAYRLRSAAWVSALTFSTSMFAFSWWWFPNDAIRREGVRQSITKFALVDFALMLVLVLAFGYVANKICHSGKLQRSRNGSN